MIPQPILPCQLTPHTLTSLSMALQIHPRRRQSQVTHTKGSRPIIQIKWCIGYYKLMLCKDCRWEIEPKIKHQMTMTQRNLQLLLAMAGYFHHHPTPIVNSWRIFLPLIQGHSPDLHQSNMCENPHIMEDQDLTLTGAATKRAAEKAGYVTLSWPSHVRLI